MKKLITEYTSYFFVKVTHKTYKTIKIHHYKYSNFRKLSLKLSSMIPLLREANLLDFSNNQTIFLLLQLPFFEINYINPSTEKEKYQNIDYKNAIITSDNETIDKFG